MTRRVMGMETEYAISGRHPNGDCLDKTFLSNEIVQVAARHLVSMPSETNVGLFLANGSRFYRDAGNHPELSSPECLTPWEVVRYVTAGDHIMRDLAHRLSQRIGRGSRVDIAKVNVDYGGSGNTWGCHESYSHLIRNREFTRDLIPHLVSRIVYTGAGGFNSISPGLEFALSPRVHHLVASVSGSSTNNRGIVHSKNEDLTGGAYNRLHLLCGESLYSQTASVLKVGSTALVLTMLERGVEDFAAWRPGNPVEAMRAIARDPTCRAKIDLVTGVRVSAVEMQNGYLSRIESALGEGWLPDWAEDLCRLWRSTLSRLGEAPESVCGTLDWAIKHVFFEKLIRESGFDEEKISRWNDFQELLLRSQDGAEMPPTPQLMNNLLTPEEIAPELEARIAPLLHERGLERQEMLRFWALRRDLFMLDARFNTVGTDSVFASLQDAGVLSHEVPEVGDIAGAMTAAPAGTRAHLRGKAIKDLAGKKGDNLCGWEFVYDQIKGLQLNLRDPFSLQESWEPAGPRRQGRYRFLRPASRSNDFLDMLQELDL